MNKNQFVYVTYIRTTPEKLWEALTKSEFTQRYWLGTKFETTWKRGASWQAVKPEGAPIVSGEILETEPPRKLVMTWRNEKTPELRAEGYSRVTYELEQEGDSVKLTILHEFDKAGSKVQQSVSNGWPLVLASLKSMLETGEPLEEMRQLVAC
jgi:uncharacterized protein YndB with AHSA1/START domain